MIKTSFGSATALALGLVFAAMPATAQDAKKPEATKEETAKKKEAVKEETPEERTKRKKAVLEKERKKVIDLLPGSKDIGATDEGLPLPSEDTGLGGPPKEIKPFRKSSDRLIADMIAPYDKCQEDPNSKEINAEYEKAYKALQAKIDHIKQKLKTDKEAQARDSRTLFDKEVKELKDELKRLEDFRNAMPKPGHCYGYHGK